MTRKRIIYQSQAVYAGPSPANTGHFELGNEGENLVKQLHRVQSAGHSFNIPRTDVRQYGQLSPIGRILLESPTVSFEFSYLLGNGYNENAIGFVTDGQNSALSGILEGSSDEKNYFVLTVPEGHDAVGHDGAANHAVYAIGNGYISNYSVEASVGDLPTASVSVEALNLNYEQGSSGNYIPAIDPETGNDIEDWEYELPEATSGSDLPVALRPGDITIDFGGTEALGAKLEGVGAAHVQSISLDLGLTREPLERLGSRFAFSRELEFPIPVSLSVTANVSDIATGKLSSIIRKCSDDGADIIISIKECDEDGQGSDAIKYILKNARLDEQSFDGSIGPSESVTLSFTSNVGGPQDTENNLYISGAYTG